MSVKNRSQATQKNNFYCDVCKINVHTEAEYALHEFSKKHCDNLVRIAKNKPVITKQKAAKLEQPPVTKEPQKLDVVTSPGKIAKYGYFVPGKIYETGTETKEFNTEYDPYLQKYAENPNKESTEISNVKPVEVLFLPPERITGFKKKKKKLRTCQICNITLLTVPEYEAHMRSPQHAWKLKMSGMGVSAHFVKASTDLHTVEVEEKTIEQESSEPAMTNAATAASSSIFPLLYCDICELLLNSELQFNAHVNGKSHNDNVQRKAEVKAKKQQLESPSPNQLYCFSCKVALNNLYQYNEHKYGKKHKMKCRRLMREGITIPPEERVSSWGMPRLDPNKPVVYPELYERFILERDKKGNSLQKIEETSENISPDSVKNLVDCANFSNSSNFQSDNNKEHSKSGDDENFQPKDHTPRMIFHKENKTEVNVINIEESAIDRKKYILGVNDVLKCSICCQNFMEQNDYDFHLTGEDHARMIVDAKEKGMKDDEILNNLLNDKNFVKPDRLGRYSCSTCTITAGHAEEFDHHITTIVHKQSEDDYKKKRIIEIKYAVKPDENGKYTCKLCQEDSGSLVEYNRHLHTSKHRDSMKAEKARNIRKKSLLKRVKKKYIISGLKRKDFACWRKKCEENPGVRTKLAATVSDACASPKETIPNVQASEGKTERNFNMGPPDRGTKRKNDEQLNVMNKRNKPNRPESYIKPLMASPFPLRPPPRLPLRHSRPMHPGNWMSYPPHHFRANCYPQRSVYPISRYYRPPNYHPPWPRYPPCYN